MPVDDADALVLFQTVRVIRATASALLCRIAGRSVWLPRVHISGRLWSTGDRGKLLIRRWVARDRQLIDPDGVAIAPPALSIPRLPAPGRLRLVRRDRCSHRAN